MGCLILIALAFAVLLVGAVVQVAYTTAVLVFAVACCVVAVLIPGFVIGAIKEARVWRAERKAEDSNPNA